MTEDRLGGRQPTSHERMTGEPWDASYWDGPAPWDVGVQPAVERLVTEGLFTGDVLDAGCGSGDNALRIAQTGVPVLGVDVAGTALDQAREKAVQLGISARFAEADALRLEQLRQSFDTVLDSGLFHTFDGDEQRAYVASLASVTRAGGRLFLLCFSDQGPDTGPHPVGEDALRSAFHEDAGWQVDLIEAERVHTRFHGAEGAPAWLACISRR